MRKIHSIWLPAFALAVAAVPLIAGAPVNRSPAQVVHDRVAGLKQMGGAFKTVMDGLRGTPQPAAMQQAARTIKNASVAMDGWFPAGSGPQRGVRTAAKPEIWTKPAEFQAAKANLARAADGFQAAAASGNADAIRAAFRPLGAACKGCHDQFRVPDQH